MVRSLPPRHPGPNLLPVNPGVEHERGWREDPTSGVSRSVRAPARRQGSADGPGSLSGRPGGRSDPSERVRPLRGDLLPLADFAEFAKERLSGLNPLSKNGRRMIRRFYGDSSDETLDSAGRVRLRANLMATRGSTARAWSWARSITSRSGIPSAGRRSRPRRPRRRIGWRRSSPRRRGERRDLVMATLTLMATEHVPVLTDELIELLDTRGRPLWTPPSAAAGTLGRWPRALVRRARSSASIATRLRTSASTRWEAGSSARHLLAAELRRCLGGVGTQSTAEP